MLAGNAAPRQEIFLKPKQKEPKKGGILCVSRLDSFHALQLRRQRDFTLKGLRSVSQQNLKGTP
jgi:hypothetical protein